MMRMRRVRYTVRLILVVVGVFGITMGVWVITNRRSETFRERARHQAEEIFAIEDEIPPSPEWESFWLSDDPKKQPPPGSFHPPGWSPPSSEDPPPIRAWRMSQARRLAYHEAMYHKYERAARYPWLPVPTDPPEPE
jgi:hypothetical protein